MLEIVHLRHVYSDHFSVTQQVAQVRIEDCRPATVRTRLDDQRRLEFGDRLLRRRSGGDHDPHGARAFEGGDELARALQGALEDAPEVHRGAWHVRGLVQAGFLDPVTGAGYALGPGFIRYDRILRQNDQLIGVGAADRLLFSWAGNPGVGSLHRLRDAVEAGWPAPLELEEHSHHGMANRYVAGASGLPFAVLRGYAGTDLVGHTPTLAPITCPFTGEQLTAVAALQPDVSIIHAQRADRRGNVQLWGITGVQKEAVFAAARSLVTVEEVVEALDPRPGAIVLPAWTVTAVAAVPGGARPSYAHDYYDRDNTYYQQWDAISRDRAAFGRWLYEHLQAIPGALNLPLDTGEPEMPYIEPLADAVFRMSRSEEAYDFAEAAGLDPWGAGGGGAPPGGAGA
jgi:glutaconate CoA-transferase, subunit A